MDCQFSEMQFAFGLMNELVNNKFKSSKGWLTPTFPTQRKERDLGYDLSIKGPVRTIFFQFKVSDKKIGTNSKYWTDYYKPYFIFKIWPDSVSQQHNNLKKLALSDPHNKVYYCAPRFYKNDDFDKHYKLGDIYRNSIYVPCGTLMTISGSDKHNIVYTDDHSDSPIMHSDKIKVESLDSEALLQDVCEAKPYDNIYECLNKVQDLFELKYENNNTRKDDEIEGPIDKYYNLSSQLQLNSDLTMLLLFG